MRFSSKYFQPTLKTLALKTAKPITPGLRHHKYVSKNILSKKNNLLKSLTFKISKCYGKSSITGHITIRGRGAGCKKLYRKLFFFDKISLGVVLFSTYDPNRTAFISAVFDFLNFKFFFIPAILGVGVGCVVGCKNPDYKYFQGFRYMLFQHLNGATLSFLSLNLQKFSKYAKSAGTYCQLLTKSKIFCKVRLPSNQIISISPLCFATLGVVSNEYHRFICIGKAGRNRLKGLRPKVRGIAMNPVDHPHGGRSNGGCCWVTPWGKPFRFKKTSRSKVSKIYKLL